MVVGMRQVPDKRYWYVKIKALAASGQWDQVGRGWDYDKSWRYGSIWSDVTARVPAMDSSPDNTGGGPAIQPSWQLKAKLSTRTSNPNPQPPTPPSHQLKAFANERKSPVGYKAFAQVCIQYHQPPGTIEGFIDRITQLEDKCVPDSRWGGVGVGLRGSTGAA